MRTRGAIDLHEVARPKILDPCRVKRNHPPRPLFSVRSESLYRLGLDRQCVNRTRARLAEGRQTHKLPQPEAQRLTACSSTSKPVRCPRLRRSRAADRKKGVNCSRSATGLIRWHPMPRHEGVRVKDCLLDGVRQAPFGTTSYSSSDFRPHHYSKPIRFESSASCKSKYKFVNASATISFSS